jgi:DNA-binding transcriptional regulator YiaG
MNTYRAWNRNEENVLKQFWGRYPMDRIQEMLPDRSAGAIKNRVRDLGLLDPNKRLMQTKEEIKDKTIDELEAELSRRKLAMELETAEKQLAKWEQDAIASQAIFSDDLLKQRSKLAGRVSNVRLRYFKLRLEQA